MTDAEILEAALAWVADDPDPDSRAAAQVLIDHGDERTLREHFAGRLEFGTAGIRGALGPGPRRMNRAMVRRVSAGLADYLLDEVPLATTRGVVIGYDGRHGSRVFAEDAAGVFAARGLAVHLHEEVCSTPQLSHAVTWLDAAGGVVVTASHNPRQDNGYKVYWPNGAQIIPPHDRGISARIDALGPTMDIEVPALTSLYASGRVRAVPREVVDAYRAEVAALRVHRDTGVRLVYTALHGVGAKLVKEVLYEAGHTDLHMVPEQTEPDGDFPTVSFPNPEEPGALDLALALAQELRADLILANDPDADRLAVVERTPDGGYRLLSGNQVGVLLASDLLTHGPQDEGRMVSTSVVSSTMLSAIAERHGAAYVDTLTGFKWIANAAIDHEAAGGRFVMGYEEALGYSIGPVVRDKDGISAALLMADLCAWCKKQGLTLLDQLEQLYRDFGYYGTVQKSLVMPGTEGALRIRELLETLRNAPPQEMGGLPLTRVRDLLTGEDRDPVSGVVRPAGLPKSNVLHFQYGPDVRILARPSGTEPKIKFYIEVREDVAEDESLTAVEERVSGRVDALVASFLTRLGVG
ncbi:MAG: phospho-sugar mutase [Deltaproteobacteria bacterium]|nr:phospho-sugar mutase [Deltaproteobacteria bacterium]